MYFTLNVMKQSEHFDEEILEKVNNKYYNPTEFNNVLNELNTHTHTQKNKLLHEIKHIFPILSLKIEPKIIGISENRLQTTSST